MEMEKSSDSTMPAPDQDSQLNNSTGGQVLQQLAAFMGSLESNSSKLQQELAFTKKQLEKAQADLLSKNNDLQQIQSELASVKSQLESKTAEAKDLGEQLSSLNQKILDLNSESSQNSVLISEKDQKIEEMTKELDQKVQLLLLKESQLGEKLKVDEKLVELQNSLNEQILIVNEATLSKESAEQVVEALQNEGDQQKQLISEFQEKLRNAELQIESLCAEKDLLISEKSLLKNQVNEFAQHQEVNSSKIAQEEQRKVEILTGLKNENTLLQNVLAEQEQRIQSLLETTQIYQEQCELNSLEISRLSDDTDAPLAARDQILEIKFLIDQLKKANYDKKVIERAVLESFAQCASINTPQFNDLVRAICSLCD